MLKYLIALVAVIHTAHAINGKCRILVLGGGSQRGAFQAGAISGLISYLPQGEAQWDVVVGNGIGALNALFVGQQAIGSESLVSTTIENFWMNFEKSQIYKSWFGGRLVGLYFRTGLYNSAPARSTINTMFAGSFQRSVLFGVTDLENNLYKVMNNSYFTNDVMLLGVEANLNSQGEFEIVNYKNSQYVSGEIAFGIDPEAGIVACQKLNYQDNQMIMDLILVNHDNLGPYDARGKNTIDNYRRFNEIENYHTVFQRITTTLQNHPKVDNRTMIVMPTKFPIDTFIPFSYEEGRGNLKDMYNAGMAGAQQAVARIV